MARTVYGRMGTLGEGVYVCFEKVEDSECLKTRTCVLKRFGRN
jgi:hypothetical protein